MIANAVNILSNCYWIKFKFNFYKILTPLWVFSVTRFMTLKHKLAFRAILVLVTPPPKFLPRGHSTTTWTKFYPILTTYPTRVDNTTYPLFPWTSVDFLFTRFLLQLTTYLHLLVHVVIEWPTFSLNDSRWGEVGTELVIRDSMS